MARRARHAAPEEAAPEAATPEETVLETRPLFLGALDVATGVPSQESAAATTSAMDALSGSLDGAGDAEEAAPPERSNGKRAAAFAAVGGVVAVGLIGTLVVLLPTDAAEKPAAEIGPSAPLVPSSSTSSTAPSTSYPTWTPPPAPVQPPPEPAKPKPSTTKPPPKKPVTTAKPPAPKPPPRDPAEDWQDAIESAINQWQEWYEHHRH
ncbi:hypothetical protein [Amycolatopsis sp. CA-230715]|uniref:hypothetical protein n=1 Tax=Amycolatopsis sp. CA-230715 TaxID=2745196 RepID=UPI001C03951B|nr:hypothetical protein [Amycolatopsis sp. CA-230715]QWF84677.1 hypothetical protein HUW46_08129 [Amycolatopsis sp. CA-230715]